MSFSNDLALKLKSCVECLRRLATFSVATCVMFDSRAEILLSMYDWKFTRLCCNTPSLELVSSVFVCLALLSLLRLLVRVLVPLFFEETEDPVLSLFAEAEPETREDSEVSLFRFFEFPFAITLRRIKINLDVYELRPRWKTVWSLSFISVRARESVASIRALNSQGTRRKSKISFQHNKILQKQ